MLIKKFLRTARVYKAQFISMVIMIAIGIGVFTGFNMEWKTIEYNTDYFFEKTNFADYRIVDAKGFKEDDVKKIEKIDGIDKAGRFFSSDAEVIDHEKDSIILNVTENNNISDFIITDGKNYDDKNENGIWLSDKYAAANNIKTGDKFSFKYLGKTIDTEVMGLIKSGEYMICITDSSQMLPDYTTTGYGYISPSMYEKISPYVIYPQINVISDMDKKTFSEEIDKTLGKASMILGKDENISYTGSRGEMEEGQTMAAILPVIFLSIAVLTMITTMHRIISKERRQIGTLKALGFKDKVIIRSYISYSLFTGITGLIPGLLIGYLLAAFIMDPNGGMMAIYIDMPTWTIKMPSFCYYVIAFVLILFVIVGYFSTRLILKETPAETLSPCATTNMKAAAIERFKFFDKFSFGTKWNIRDLLRHKARLVMSLFGVFGCTLLMVGALGMRDTFNYFLDGYYDSMVNYESRIYISDKATNEDIDILKKDYGQAFSSEETVKLKDLPVTLEVYDIGKDMIKLNGRKNVIDKLSDDGAYICTRIADKYNLSKGDKLTVERYNSDDKYTFEIADIINNLTEGIIISPKYADKTGVDYKIRSLYTDTDAKDIKHTDAVSSVKSKKDIINSFDTMTYMMNVMVMIFIFIGMVLAIIVLYNLGTMSYMERYRELSTLKVVGFKDRQLRKLITQQNLWITVIGTIPGIPIGFAVLSIIAKMLASEYELIPHIYVHTYIFCIAISFITSLIVSLMLSSKNKKIDMVEAMSISE